MDSIHQRHRVADGFKKKTNKQQKKHRIVRGDENGETF